MKPGIFCGFVFLWGGRPHGQRCRLAKQDAEHYEISLTPCSGLVRDCFGTASGISEQVPPLFPNKPRRKHLLSRNLRQTFANTRKIKQSPPKRLLILQISVSFVSSKGKWNDKTEFFNVGRLKPESKKELPVGYLE